MTRAAKDWHPEDIKAAIRKTGVTLSELSLANGLPEYACRMALQGPFFDAEMVIAERLGLSPRQIWPSRYYPNGQRRHRIRIQRRKNDSSNRDQPLVQSKEAA